MTTSCLVQDDGHTPLASAFSSRPVSRPTTVARGAAEQQLQGMLASKESEAALLRQQLAQLTADFKFNLKVGLSVLNISQLDGCTDGQSHQHRYHVAAARPLVAATKCAAAVMDFEPVPSLSCHPFRRSAAAG
jgi:hypothetical protein